MALHCRRCYFSTSPKPPPSCRCLDRRKNSTCEDYRHRNQDRATLLLSSIVVVIVTLKGAAASPIDEVTSGSTAAASAPTAHPNSSQIPRPEVAPPPQAPDTFRRTQWMRAQASTRKCLFNITQLTKRRKYDRRNPPRLTSSTDVQIGIYINSFNYISEQSMDYEINIYLREQWSDPRLSFDRKWICGKPWVRLPEGTWDHIWIPDVFFRNEKRAKFHSVTLPNRMMRLYPNGTVYYAAKVTTTLSCPMKLHKYPMDTQECPIQFESFGHTMDVVTYSWRPKAVEKELELMLPQFELQDTQLLNCSQVYATGSYPCLQVTFILVRNIGYYIIQLYVPSILIVILSWVAFWISIDAIPARVTIGLLTVLTMTTQSASARASLPRVSYVKAMDVWMSVCLVFVFASLLEFAVVNVYSRKEFRRKGLRALTRNMEDLCVGQFALLGNSDVESSRNVPMSPGRREEMRQRARLIDKLARKLFPLAFVLFNVMYWIGYNLW